MNDQIDIRKRLDACPYVYLGHFEPGEHLLDLKLEVLEARAQPHETHKTNELPVAPGDNQDTEFETVVGILTENSYAIRSLPGYAVFTIVFENYVAFNVRNETYVIPEESEDFSKKLRTYEKSSFLDYVAKSTWVSDVSTEPLKHFAIVCLNLVVDVICAKEPVIKMEILDDAH